MALIHYESETLKQDSTFKEQEKFLALFRLYTLVRINDPLLKRGGLIEDLWWGSTIESTFGYFHFDNLEFEPSGSEVTLNPTSFKSKMASSVKRLCFTLNGQNNL